MSAMVWGVSAALFLAGLAAVVLRRQFLAMLLGLELMISAVNVALVYCASLFADEQGLSAGLLVIAVAAAEAVVGLSLILAIRESNRPAETAAFRELRG